MTLAWGRMVFCRLGDVCKLEFIEFDLQEM